MSAALLGVGSASAASDRGYPRLPGLNKTVKPHADQLTIRNNSGGNVARFAMRVADLRRQGTRVRIAGRCDSACTLYLGLPGNQMCVSRGASFRFHAPYIRSGKTSQAAQRFMYASYPGWVRSWISSKGGLSRRLITMDYDYARRFLPEC